MKQGHGGSAENLEFPYSIYSLPGTKSAQEKEKRKKRRRRCFIIILSVLFPLLLLGDVLVLIRVFQRNAGGLAFYFILLAAGHTAILKTTNVIIFVFSPLVIFFLVFAITGAFYKRFAVPLSLILAVAWIFALLLVLLQIKTQRATNTFVSLIWGGLFFIFGSIIIISLPLTFLSQRGPQDANQKEGIRVIAFPVSAIIVLCFLSFHFHLFKDVRKRVPQPDPVRRKQLIKCQISYLVLLSVAFCLFTMGLLLRLQDEIVGGTSSQQRPVLVVLVTLPVLFLFCSELLRGILPYRNKYLLYPLSLFFPLIFLSNLALNLGPGEFFYILDAVALMSPIVGVLFTTLLEMMKRSQIYCMFMTGLVSIGVVMAFAYVTLVQLNEGQVSPSTNLVLALGIISCLIILGVLAYNIQKFRERSRKRKLCALASNYTDLGHWFNTSGFIVGEGILIYVGFNYPISTDLRYGFTIACGFGIFLLFLVVNLILQQRSHIPEGDEDSNYFDYVFHKAFKNIGEEDEVALRQDSISDAKLMAILLVILLVIVPSTLLPIGLAVTTVNGAVQSALILSAIFSAIIGTVAIVAMEVKKKLGPYSRNGLPLCLSMMWAFVALPFLAFLPVATIITGGQQGSIEIIMTASLLVMAALLVIGTSLLSIILNEVFSRIGDELKAKLTVVWLYESLKKIAVKGEPTPLRLCVDTYIWKGRKQLQQRLLAEDLVVAWELPPSDPDLSVSKVIIMKEFYQKMERRSAQQKKRADYREMKIEEKFEKAVEKRKLEKKKLKHRHDRMKEAARRKAERLEALLAKEQILKKKLLEKDNLGESKSSLTHKEENEQQVPPSSQREPPELIQSGVETDRLDISKTQKKASHSEGPQASPENSVSHFSKFLDGEEDEKEDEEQEEALMSEEKKKKLKEIRNALRIQNYRVLTSHNSTKEEKLVAVFELISEESSVHTIQQLLRISQKPLDALEKELFAYFANDASQKRLERKELKLLFQVFETKSEVEEYLREGEDTINQKRFKAIIEELSFREYPAYSRSKARQLFLTGVVYYRLSYYQQDFGSHAFALYLLNSIRKEVEEIREKRIREQLQIEEEEEEEGKEEDEEQGQPQQKEKQVNEGGCCKKCGPNQRKKCKKDCLKRIICVRNALRWATLKLVICCCFAGAYARHRELESEEFQEEISEEQIERLRPFQRRGQEMLEHRPSPEWPEISKYILSETKAALELYDPKRGLAWRCVSANVVMLLIKLLEFFSFLTFMWSSDIPWNFSAAASASLTAVNGDATPSLQTYYYFYGASLFLAILYTFLVRPAAVKARDGTLGMNKNRLPAKFCSRAFFFSKIVQLMSVSFYTFIIKTLLDAFSCDFTDSTQSVLLKQRDVQCFGGPHFGLMAGALVGILAYYPFATFLYPNLQFVNKDTDLKYSSQFMVYLAQAKLIFSSLSSFLHSSDTQLIVRLILMAATTLFLGLMSAYQQPCLVAQANIFHTAGYFSVSYLIIMTIFIVLAFDNLIVVALMLAGLFVIWLLTTLIACIKKRRHEIKEKKRREEQPPPQ